ncbi:TVP38/TMEM64 family protein [Bacillus sp. 1P06AnD]|uniref:TVP38/TMEM64 family protein n=1 Tax=Bacillus sp. 1P06AnD TaxID=3132208 RepID=UPI0039A21B62
MRKKFYIISIWILFVYILKHFHFVSFDLNTVKEFISEYQNYAFLLFIVLWIVRLFFLVPGTPLIILGGLCFSPIEGLLLSTVGLVLSETLVYLFSRSFAGHIVKKQLENRHPELNNLLETYNYKFLALGIICPIAPTDVTCFLSASIGIKYSTYILTIIIANMPLRLLYSFIGISFSESMIGLALVIGSLVLVIIASIKIWNNLKQKTQLQQF